MTPRLTRISRAALACAAPLALAFAATLVITAAAEARPFTSRDLVTLNRVSDPRISPDTKWVVYNLRIADLPNNKSRQEMWLASTDGKVKPHRIGGETESWTSPRWSPDGASIYFSSGKSGSSQVWRMPASGGAATQVTSLPLDVGSFKVSPDGKRMVVSLAVFPDCPDVACTVDRQAEKAKSKASGQKYDRVFVRHWDTWDDGTKNQLFSLTLDANGQAVGATPLMRGFDGDSPTKPYGGDEDYVITPDSAAVLFSARVAGKTEAWSTNFDLWRVPLDGSAAPENRTPNNPAWDAAGGFTPDGKGVYRAAKRPGYEADRFGVIVREGDGKGGFREREVAPAWDRSADAVAWSDGGKALVVMAGDRGQESLFRMDAKTGKVKNLTGDGHVTAFDTAGGKIVYASDNIAAPADLYLVSTRGGKATRLTSHNADKLADIEMGTYEQFSFPGWNGETVYGYVVKPAGTRPGDKLPVAMIIHGGPQSSMGNLFHYRWNPQTYVGKGYAAVLIDFHGSTGYGQGFTDAIAEHWGDRPLEDLQKGWAYALARYDYLDGDRACAIGASYGGFMVNWIAGTWREPWKCLVSHDGIFDNRMMGYATEEMWFSEWENGGTQFEHPQNYEKFNPVNHVADWTVPTLVIHSGLDYRIPYEQGLAAFGALQRRGVESQFLYFPDENHWVLKPANSVQWHDTVEAWMDRFTKGGTN